MRPPAWCADWVGIPFAEKGRGPHYDCWGLARAVLAARLGAELPDYVDAYTGTTDKESVAAAVRAGLATGWERVDSPQPLCLVILRLAGRPWHCGVMADERWMLHTTAGTGSCVERVNSLQWRERVAGFYSVL